jgi:hypothetical protein
MYSICIGCLEGVSYCGARARAVFSSFRTVASRSLAEAASPRHAEATSAAARRWPAHAGRINPRGRS